MPWQKKEEPKFATLTQALNEQTVDELKRLLALLPAAEKPTRKFDIISVIKQQLEGPRLRELWERLDEPQRQAVSETAHAPDSVFNANRFQAKYGSLPSFGTGDRWSYQRKPSLLCLFIYSQYGGLAMPEDLKARLQSFVPKPAAPALKLTDELPEFFELREETYEYEEEGEAEDEGLTLITPQGVFKLAKKPPRKQTRVTPVPLTRRDTERAAQQELPAILRLIDKGKVAVSDKTFQPSSAAMTEIAALLRDGDYYELTPKKNRWEQEIGPVKAFAWPLLVQGARLAELHGKKLALTKAGRAALGASAPETLKLIWQRWLKAKLLDEFNRVEAIKGQCGKGKRSMTAAESRRASIAEALAQCPAGSWVSVDDFFRFMQAAAFDFEVTREPWDLYISDANYGSLGYAGYHDWPILQGRYTLCLLFEYAATLGLLDLAYVHPAGVRRDFKKMWGTDEMVFLSRYDGLRYFRLNSLGAYCLGTADQYVPSQITARAALTVLPSLQIKVTGAELLPDEAMLLETYAEKESDRLWHLSRDKTLAAVESGLPLAELREFLQARDEQPLPETVEGFIIKTEKQARALSHKGTALLIECAEAEVAEAITAHERLKKLCLRAGERHLVVPVEAEEQFRKAIHSLGYGMPRG
jgi:DNA-binding transcriptional MerR regulator